ncbi:MAG: hypothetical protein QXL20_05135 [Candidatus Bathyarchaeia archaeon]
MGIPKRPKINVSDLIRAAELKLITFEEFRDIMREMGWQLKR